MRRWMALLLVAGAALACRGQRDAETEASARFRQAWEKRRNGDESGYEATMKEIATRWPDSKAGRRARDETGRSPLQSGTMVGAAMAGAAALAVPTFMKYRAQASGSAPPDAGALAA